MVIAVTTFGEKKEKKLMFNCQVEVQFHLEKVLESYFFPDKSVPIVASEGLL